MAESLLLTPEAVRQMQSVAALTESEVRFYDDQIRKVARDTADQSTVLRCVRTKLPTYQTDAHMKAVAEHYKSRGFSATYHASGSDQCDGDWAASVTVGWRE